jgi:hypothetical protein
VQRGYPHVAAASTSTCGEVDASAWGWGDGGAAPPPPPTLPPSQTGMTYAPTPQQHPTTTTQTVPVEDGFTTPMFDFIMCNPPFFENTAQHETPANRSGARPASHASMQGASTEMCGA